MLSQHRLQKYVIGSDLSGTPQCPHSAGKRNRSVWSKYPWREAEKDPIMEPPELAASTIFCMASIGSLSRLSLFERLCYTDVRSCAGGCNREL